MAVQTTSSTRLLNHWLIVARIAWAVITILTVIIILAGLPSYYVFFQRVFLTDNVLPQSGLPANLRAVYYFILDLTFITIFAVTAFIVFWRRSNDAIAVLVSIMLLTYIVLSLPIARPLSDTNPYWILPISLLAAIASACTFILPFVFPNGKFVPSWTRWLALVYTVIAVLPVIASGSILDITSWPAIPNSIIQMLIYSSCIAAQIYRYRVVASPQQRQQTKWIILGVVTALVGYFTHELLYVIFPALNPETHPSVGNILLHIVVGTFYRGSEMLIPLTITFSILRYRLWDVDFLLNRSLVYGALTALLAILFFAVIFILQGVFQTVTGGNQSNLAAVVATLCVVSVFSPTRTRLRRFVDHRFYNIEIDYEKRPKAPAQPPNATSKTNFGPYSGLDLIGRGGMAEVYKAEHPTLNRTVAIKILPVTVLSKEDLRKRFEREAKMVAKLKHPNIVQVFEFGEVANTPYMVMEYIAGQDLQDYLKHTGALSLEQAMPIIKDIAQALDFAHSNDLIHRDIKPSNIMLEHCKPDSPEIERAVLMDFGIARMLSGTTHLTAGLLGTLDYMAPEQIQEAPNIDGRADVYAFGVMLYQMLTGQLPFIHANPGALLIAHLTQPAPDPRSIKPDLPPEVSLALRRALAKTPDERYPTAGALVNDLNT